MKNKPTFLFLFLLAGLPVSLFAQDDLLSLLGDEETIDYATASFKTNRVINGHSIENTARGVLDFKISHRFSPVDEGFYDIFGLDGATIRFGLDYGITDRLMVGFGRNSKEKIYDGFVKYKILRQSSGKRNMPITLSYLADAQLVTVKNYVPEGQKDYFENRFFYTHQLLIGRKFSEAITLQLMPTLVHRNLVATPSDKNDVFSLGIAGRVKLTKRIAFNVEYYYVLPDQVVTTPQANALSVGFDIETGGHVFQLHFTNASDMTYKGFITETPNNWFYQEAGKQMTAVRFGFNISRVFTIIPPKGF